MSVAGAQNKLPVVYRNDALFEPVGSEPSTHILKPNHLGDDYPASVINEYFVMSLARSLGLSVPPVLRRYTPEPVYIIERFDRLPDNTGRTQRRHIIDACQLLSKSRSFKYTIATLKILAEIVEYCRNRVLTRLSLYRWLVFNLALANTDNHLKNLLSRQRRRHRARPRVRLVEHQCVSHPRLRKRARQLTRSRPGDRITGSCNASRCDPRVGPQRRRGLRVAPATQRT
jgi:serine/threonine-protein kinase HipA